MTVGDIMNFTKSGPELSKEVMLEFFDGCICPVKFFVGKGVKLSKFLNLGVVELVFSIMSSMVVGILLVFDSFSKCSLLCSNVVFKNKTLIVDKGIECFSF